MIKKVVVIAVAGVTAGGKRRMEWQKNVMK